MIYRNTGASFDNWRAAIEQPDGSIVVTPPQSTYEAAMAEARKLPKRPSETHIGYPVAETLGTKTQQAISSVMKELEEMLLSKNRSYGDSALDPVRVFSQSDELEAIRVRIDDKLSRVARGRNYPGEDTIDDLIGYLVLLKIGIRNS
jgi:hypothetical protein